jgi:protein FAM50
MYGQREEKAKKKKKKNQSKIKLSFAADDEAEAEEDKEVVKKPKLGKDPNVDTSFLPDRDREEVERLQREELRQQWLKKQEETKGEALGTRAARCKVRSAHTSE